MNTNGFWQGPGPLWTHCWSRKKTSGKEGQEGGEAKGGEGKRGSGPVQKKRPGVGGFTRFTTAPSVFVRRALQALNKPTPAAAAAAAAAHRTSKANHYGWV